MLNRKQAKRSNNLTALLRQDIRPSATAWSFCQGVEHAFNDITNFTVRHPHLLCPRGIGRRKRKRQSDHKDLCKLRHRVTTWFLFLLCRLIANKPCKSASVKPDWKHKPRSRPFVEPIQRASWSSGHLAFLLVRDWGVLQQIALSAHA